MLNFNVYSETSILKSVILGIAFSNGATPKVKDCYDPKSIAHILEGTYPVESDMISELEDLATVFKKHDVTVYRPNIINDYNQIFSRDIGFVIENKFIRSNILPDRDKEIHAIDSILAKFDQNSIYQFPQKAHIEGGDVILWNEYVFVGTYSRIDYPDIITARTNMKAVEAIRRMFPEKIVKSFELRKSNTDALSNALHLDCCFQPIGLDMVIIHKDGFLLEDDYQFLVSLFGKSNVFEITKEEMYQMQANVFSISPEVIVSEKSFTRLNIWLKSRGFLVEEVSFSEISKLGGLLRCCTLPLERC